MPKTNEGKIDKSIGRGQTLRTPIGKDDSDWAGKASDEVPAKIKMGGSMDNLSHTLKG